KLGYTTNDDIAEMFINLLAKASSSDTVNLAHPSFVQLIERLSVDEAKIITYLKTKAFIPYVSYRLKRNSSSGFVETLKKATMIPFEVELIFPQNIKTYIDNLLSMGILFDEEGSYKVDENIYKPLFEKYQYENTKNELSA